ncbi:hypothetical protein QFZ51_000793 [Chitinophaga sp. W3I9]
MVIYITVFLRYAVVLLNQANKISAVDMGDVIL